MSEPKTRRGQIAADVNQLMSVSSEGLGLIIIKLFLVNTKNINNHSVNLDNYKSDFEPGLVPKWDSCYVCWLLPSCHMVLPCALAKQCVFQYLPLSDFSCLTVTWCVVGYLSSQNHNRYITSSHRQNRWQQTNSCTNKDIFLLHYQHYITA